MKTKLLLLAILALPYLLTAQLPPATVTARGPHHRVWSRVTEQRRPDGSTVLRTNSYVELAAGLCYQQDGQGPWLDSQEVIEVLPDGSGLAWQGQHQVHFPVNLKEDAIDLLTPDGKRFRSRPMGLAY